MVTQTHHLEHTPLLANALNPLRKNTSSVTVRSPPQLITRCRHVPRSQLSISAPKREKDTRKRVVITGMGLVSVFGNNVDTYYERLLAGESGVKLIDRFDASEFPTRFGAQICGFDSDGYIMAKNDRRLDDCQRYCIVAGKKALEDAGLGGVQLSKIDKERAGVLVGTGMGGTTVFSDGLVTLMEMGYKKVSPFLTPYSIPSMGPASLAIDVGFMGPTYAIAAACATSNYCFSAAANHIREGVADLMIAGGVDACFNPINLAGFSACNALSKRNDDPQAASRPWDQSRDGLVMGEGAGILVMESLEHAMKRDAPIIAEYLGGATNSDAYNVTDPRPDSFGVTSCIQSSLLNAGVSLEEVNYINAHATSTKAGDIAEIRALKNVFKNREGIKINATKSMIGHALGAAGGMEAIATIKAIQTGWVHPTINQFNLVPEVEFDTVANHKQQHEINVAISNSFGLGGHNSVVAFSAFKP
ncbi:hypothetical protein E3N88_33286 [Mikania micrantha]|uniref:3-oxoacyl-[acyl-carrier-protein] synthase I, chloroplastic n=1 Tax=Mikania micrantha TaxID=192012 RepID=A0A5N6MBI1_9ASTR|nr:hypothetical protein E3N88_33286 [Mikania micrantha]